mgnify:FL=1
MIVKYQQIAPVIDRRRTMLPNDPTTRFAACATVIGIHHTERRSCPGSPSRSSRQLLRRKIPGQDHHVVRTRTIQAKSRIFRLVFPPRRNLRTTSALVDHKCRITFFVFCIRQSPNKFGFAFTYRKRPIAAVEKSVLQLHRPPVKDSDPTQGIVKAVLSVAQPMKHKRLAHKSVNEWRVHAVPPEMTGPGEPVGQPGNTAKAAA